METAKDFCSLINLKLQEMESVNYMSSFPVVEHTLLVMQRANKDSLTHLNFSLTQGSTEEKKSLEFLVLRTTFLNYEGISVYLIFSDRKKQQLQSANTYPYFHWVKIKMPMIILLNVSIVN